MAFFWTQIDNCLSHPQGILTAIPNVQSTKSLIGQDLSYSIFNVQMYSLDCALHVRIMFLSTLGCLPKTSETLAIFFSRQGPASGPVKPVKQGTALSQVEFGERPRPKPQYRMLVEQGHWRNDEFVQNGEKNGMRKCELGRDRSVCFLTVEICGLFFEEAHKYI